MYICEECGKESFRIEVCTQCGLVVNDRPIANYPERIKNLHTVRKEYVANFKSRLAPNLAYLHVSKKKYYKKDSEDYRYAKAWFEIRRYCGILRVSNVVINESLNLYINVRKKNPKFFISHDLLPSYLAFIKIACEINYVPIERDELFSLEQHKWDAKKIWEIYQDYGKDAICPHCQRQYKNDIGLKRHLIHLEKRGIRKKFNKAYIDTLNLLNLNLRSRKLKIYEMTKK